MSSNPTPTQIKQTRKQAGLSVPQAAKLMDVTRMTIYNWENGTHPMKPRDFEYLQMKISLLIPAS